MNFFKRKRYYLHQVVENNSDPISQRNNVRILIIDDMEVPYLKNLRNSHFNVKHVKDIDSFDIVSKYDVIICDIKGVGISLAPREQGIYIINQTSMLYPEKYIIAMSSGIYNMGILKRLDGADKKIIRDTDPSKVLTEVTDAVNIMKSNKERWLRLRNYLIEKEGMDLHDVWEIEQKFIESTIKKDQRIFSESKIVKHSSDVLKGLLINFITGMVIS
ncbi:MULTISPECIES: hypothetical protein [unclassified Vibrio]|uniref:hypothetical protein n=1 Tax=unclassified Vibrio TaxID=2614977 RepID=UPI002964B4F8|nr:MULTISPECIES: hypothetical protein [unclassified Vibrio]MDW1593611.1 hypothetical protein [Vibrio sp. Vb2944]MDW1612159.1 hypothetical protein [Vibrio sp. Vb2908]